MRQIVPRPRSGHRRRRRHPLLRRFAVAAPAASCSIPPRALHIVRRRLDGIGAAAGVSIAEFDVGDHLPQPALDLEADRVR